MRKNMICIMECPDCIEENRIVAGMPKQGDTFFCPTCGEMFVVGAKWLRELDGIMDDIYDSIDRFVESRE
jgi:NMD protein affecting ribosome stability and mRNA decay